MVIRAVGIFGTIFVVHSTRRVKVFKVITVLCIIIETQRNGE
jgi:hypothetical protein